MIERPVSVVIPSLNERPWIASAIRSAKAAGASIVVVSDGGSVDGTPEAARDAGAEVIEAGPPRGYQLSEGAARIPADHILCFLHADTTLPEDACDLIRGTLREGSRYGGFTLRFAEDSMRLRLVEGLINLRSQMGGGIWGDQAQFFERSLFEEIGGYREIPIMEDYEIMRRARAHGRPALITTPVVTSGRRFLTRGVLRTTARNWWTIARFHAGVPVERLAAGYRRGSS